jgi:competence protein ComEA
MVSNNETPRMSRRTRTGAIMLLGLLLFLILVWRLLPLFFPAKEHAEDKQLQQAWNTFRLRNRMDTARSGAGVVPEAPAGEVIPEIKARLFFFDPNTATEQQLVSLGLPARTVKTLIKYRNKGGRFYKKEDLQKLYTLRKEDYERVLPYVRIVAMGNTGQQGATYSGASREEPGLVDLNKADAVALMRLRGIGPGYSRRILNFRDALGGFIAVEQLKEVFGFPDSTYQLLKDKFNVKAGDVRLINVNKATEEELGRHPYIGKRLAAQIIRLREGLKEIREIEQLRQTPLINEEKYRKIAPYLSTH